MGHKVTGCDKTPSQKSKRDDRHDNGKTLGILVVDSMCPDGRSEQCMRDKIPEGVYGVA